MSAITADLHLHTIHSDGTWTPKGLVAAAHARGLSTIAVTDHDTTAGVRAVQQAAAATSLKVVAGVELSLLWGEQSVDTLGYFIDPDDPVLQAETAALRSEREERAARMVEKLERAGAVIALADVRRIAGQGAVGRPHVAQALVEAGHASSVADAFARWIGKGRPGYVDRRRVTPAVGIGWIRAAGGVSVLAHPGLLKDDSIIPALVDAGLQGIEAYYPTHTPADVVAYLRLAERYGLVVTGGSDCHGPGGPKGAVVLGSCGVGAEAVARLEAARHHSQ
ncbi:MAG TPA: PHP domain-containing protein [Limnochordia bacterium]|nr:PHP domain-containing protein [Limnochordia bacterium]